MWGERKKGKWGLCVKEERWKEFIAPKKSGGLVSQNDRVNDWERNRRKGIEGGGRKTV